MRITALIPAYNVEKYIQRCIDSVLKQTYKPFEILVIDDGSTDNTAELIKAYGKKVTYLYQENAGVSSARNLGIIEAKGDWIAFLDSDDEWVETHLENFMLTIQKKDDLKWYGAPVRHVDQETRRVLYDYNKRYDFFFIHKPYFEDYLSAIPPLGFFSVPTMIINKLVFSKIGLFDINKKNGEDRDMWFRISLRYPSIGFTGKIGAIVYKRNGSVTRIKKFSTDDFIERYLDYENYARLLGEDYLKRAKPRLQNWITSKLKESISIFDYDSVAKIKQEFGHYLSFKYNFLAYMILKFPFIFNILAIKNKSK